MKYLLGIDLGTTNCTVTAIDEEGKTSSIVNNAGDFVTPSAVYFCEQENTFIVGKKAKALASSDVSGNLVTLVKRQMGSDKLKVRKNPITGKYKPYDYWGKTFSPEEISSKILKQLKDDAEKQLGTEIKEVVITCPAYFKQAQKEATRVAGELAGFEVLEIITEPTAAALSYSMVSEKIESTGKETVFVFDLGGGTFDVTIIEITKDSNGISVNTKYTDGDARLGGADWDNIARGDVVKKFKDKYNVNLALEKGPEKEIAMGKLSLDIENLKKELSNPQVMEAEVTLEYKGHSITEKYTREKYSNVTNEFTEKCRIKCMNLIKDANMSWNDIDTVLMVGSMSNCIFIREALEKWSGKKVLFGNMDPKTCVSTGAALYAHKFYCNKIGKEDSFVQPVKEKLDYVKADGNEEAVKAIIEKEKNAIRGKENLKETTSVLPASICLKGLRNGQEVCKQMLLRNWKYPCSFEKDFPISFDNMIEVKLPVLEGESENPQNNTELGIVILPLDGNNKRGDLVHVKFEIDNSGIIQVLAIDKKTNKQVVGRIQRNSLLSLDEIQQAKKDSENDLYLM